MLAAAAPAFAISAAATNLSVPSATSANPNTDPTVPEYDVKFTSPAVPGSAVTVVTVGQKIVVSGTDAADFNTVTVYWDSVSASNVLGTTAAGAPPNQDNTKHWNVTITIPESVHGTHNIIVSDGTANVAKQVTVAAKISTGLTVRALPGDSVTVTGSGFAANTDIDLTFAGNPVDISVRTNAAGSFSATIIVPDGTTLSTTPYEITATDGTSTALTTLTVCHYVTVTPSGVGPAPVPPGVTVTIAGRIKANTAFSITIDALTIFEGTSAADGKFTTTYTLPNLMGAGSHTIKVIATGLTPSEPQTTLVVGLPPKITLTPNNGAAGEVIRVQTVTPDASTGSFNGKANITLSFGSVVVNSTSTDDRFGPTTGAGLIDAYFSVPTLAPGTYTVTVTDQYGAVAQTTFTIAPTPDTTIELSSTAYKQGDTIIFNIRTTESTLGTIFVVIRDPSNNVVWDMETGSTAWTLSLQDDDITRIVKYEDQVDTYGSHLVLPANAATGTWNWTVAYTPGSGSAKSVSGLFTVTAGGNSAILDAITDLKGTIESIQGDVVTIKTSVGTSVTTTLSAIQGKVTSIENSIATLSIPDLGTITTKLDSIDAVLGTVAGDTATLKTSIGDVTTTMSSLNAKIVSIENGVATIETDVGTLQGVVTEVKDGVATINTGIGNVQTSVTNLQPKVEAANDNTASMSSMIYVAVAFAIIAAIAAVASILLMRKKIAS